MNVLGNLRLIGAILIGMLATAMALPAQMAVKQERQPTALVKEVLIGPGILVDNVHFAGMIAALGEFSNPTVAPLFSSGIILSTGNATDMVGPNDNPRTSTVNGTPGDKNLYTLAGGRTFDGAKLAFDFKADKDSVTLDFIFASEEYHDYVGSSFNDAFAVVVSGPGFGTGKNLAVLPGTTTPITVNSINPNQNRQYFVDNNPYTLVGRINETARANLNQDVLANFEFDGMTKTFSVGFRVTPKQVYHFEIVVSDAGDGNVDSAVLLDGKSFRSLEQSKHALRRQQLAEQRRADSLARAEVVADSLARVQAEADSLAQVAEEAARADALRRSNQARLDSMARAEESVRIARARQDSILKAQEEQAKRFLEEQQRQDSLAQAQAEQEKRRLVQQQRQDSLAKAQAAQAASIAERRRQDSIANAALVQPKTSENPVGAKPGTDTQAPVTEIKETLLFDPSSYFVSAEGEKRLHDLGKLLAAQPELRAGIYLPQGEPSDILNMRYDMMRFELLKSGAKADQIFRNGFSFANAAAKNSIQRGEVWIRKEQ
jgi:flagellar motor protein MotB